MQTPPFGSKAGSKRALREDIPYPRANKQLVFLQHIYTGLKVGGRAAVVMPDNVLFEEGIGKVVRNELMKACDLHTVLRLPTGIFSSAGIKTNVLFFSKPKSQEASTKETWFFDMRTNMPRFGKGTPLKPESFLEFEKCFGAELSGKAARKDEGESGRFRCFTREDIFERNDSLDICWLKPEQSDDQDQQAQPEDIAALILGHLRAAVTEIETVVDELADNSETKR